MDTKWITLPEGLRDGNRFFYARRRWRLDAPAAATLRISADCRYRAWLNGRLVGRGPVRGSTTLCFYDTSLIEMSLLTEHEREWINNYHERVYQQVSPLLTADEAEWLRRKCKAI